MLPNLTKQQSLPFGGAPVGRGILPMGMSQVPLQQPTQPPPQNPPELQLPRFMNYYADYSGCGHWRMIWPEQVMNAHQKAVVHGSTVMNGDGNQYVNVQGVRIQRQAHHNS
jgi:hypothetical protein